MSSVAQSASSAAHTARSEASPWVERLARAGYLGKGILYVLVALLALNAAFSGGGGAEGSKGALATLAGEGWFGTVLLWIIMLGLFGYAAWNAFRAIVDPENEGDDKKGIAKRIFFGLSAVTHTLLAVWVATHLLGSSGGGGSGGSGGGGGGGGGSEGLVAKVLAWGTIGRILVAAAGLGIIGYAVKQFLKSYKDDLSDMLDLSSLSQKARKTVETIARVGLAARGVVFTVVGWFFIQAAWQYSSDKAGGLGQALQTMGAFGPWLLGLVAIGLLAYGVHMGVKSRYRRIGT